MTVIIFHDNVIMQQQRIKQGLENTGGIKNLYKKVSVFVKNFLIDWIIDEE